MDRETLDLIEFLARPVGLLNPVSRHRRGCGGRLLAAVALVLALASSADAHPEGKPHPDTHPAPEMPSNPGK